MGAKTANARSASHTNEDISWQSEQQRYKMEGEALLERIVTGDETCVYCYQPESKLSSKR